MTKSVELNRNITSPVSIFTSMNKRDDFTSPDMRCGDLSENQLKSSFNLWRVSNEIDVYAMKRFPISANYSSLSISEASKLLFNEFRTHSKKFSFSGPYKNIIGSLIDHMEKEDGRAYKSSAPNRAYKNLIEKDKSDNSSLLMIKNSLKKYSNGGMEISKKAFAESFSLIRLPKFRRWQDNFNGMGISIHDIHHTEIVIESIKFDGESYHAIINYRAQDHFGLDDEDILDNFFYQFKIFRIWFILQRYKKYAFKPFFTNMEARIEVYGE